MKTLLCILISGAFGLGSQDILPLELITSSGFAAESADQKGREYPPRSSYIGFRPDRIMRLEIEAVARTRRPTHRMADLGPQTPGAKLPPSGLPLGERLSYCRLQPGSRNISIITEFAVVSVIMTPKARTDAKGFWVAPNHDWTDDAKLLERIARITFSRAAGRRLIETTARTMGGASVASASCRHSNRAFGSLSEWCSRRGWSVTEDTEYGYYTIRKGGHYAIVPVGADQIKIDGQWIDLPDYIVEHEGQIYVPQEALERANQTG